jgi:hypothetical protein
MITNGTQGSMNNQAGEGADQVELRVEKNMPAAMIIQRHDHQRQQKCRDQTLYEHQGDDGPTAAKVPNVIAMIAAAMRQNYSGSRAPF